MDAADDKTTTGGFFTNPGFWTTRLKPFEVLVTIADFQVSDRSVEWESMDFLWGTGTMTTHSAGFLYSLKLGNQCTCMYGSTQWMHLGTVFSGKLPL